MSKVKDEYLKFNPLEGADGYRVYYQEDGPIDQENTPNVDIGDKTSEISMHAILGDVESNFTIGVVGYDMKGNEGDLTVIVEQYPFDFVPPAGLITGGEIYSID